MDSRFCQRANLENAVRYGLKYVFDELFSVVKNVDKAYSLAIEYKREDMADYLEPLVEDFSLGLQAAAKIGNKGKISRMIMLGARSYVYALRGAAKGGQVAIFEAFLSKVDRLTMGADIMYHAAQGRNLIIVKLVEEIYDKELKRDKTVLGRNGMRGAASVEDVSFIDYFSRYPGANLAHALWGSLESFDGDISRLRDGDMVEELVERRHVAPVPGMLEEAGKASCLPIVKYLIRKGAEDLDAGLAGAAKAGDFDMIDYFIGIGAKSDLCLDEAVKQRDIDTVIYLHEKHDFAYTPHSLYLAKEGGDSELIRLLS